MTHHVPSLRNCGLSKLSRLTPLALLLVLGGCQGSQADRTPGALEELRSGASRESRVLRIATPWPRRDRRELEADFQNRAGSTGPIRIIWTEVPPGAPFQRISEGCFQVDVVLGGPLTEYVRLARVGKLESLGGEGNPLWSVARRSLIEPDQIPGELAGRMAFDDPRVSPVSLTWAAAQLRDDSWKSGYASLVQLFGHSIYWPGWRAGFALAAASRRRGDLWVPNATTLPRSEKHPDLEAKSIIMEEGAGVLKGTAHEEASRAFLAFLAARPRFEGGPLPLLLDPDESDLLADLLGATLVDAQDELSVACEVLDRGGGASAQGLVWLSESPPWPPASVERLLGRGGDKALAMVHDLAGQIAPDPPLRFWLVQSWLRPRRLIDASLLKELAHAEGGRLTSEPRFRAWLRGEWTAWARQRYRRVARLAALGAVSTAESRPRSSSR